VFAGAVGVAVGCGKRTGFEVGSRVAAVGPAVERRDGELVGACVGSFDGG